METTNYHSKVRPTDKIHEVKVPINVTEIALEVFQNCPEASMSLRCISYDYGFKNNEDMTGTKSMTEKVDPNKFKFVFVDEEDDDKDGNPMKYTVDIKMAEMGVVLVIKQVLAGTLCVGGLKTMSDLLELGNWDAEVVDAAIQCAIFGEVIYG